MYKIYWQHKNGEQSVLATGKTLKEVMAEFNKIKKDWGFSDGLMYGVIRPVTVNGHKPFKVYASYFKAHSTKLLAVRTIAPFSRLIMEKI